MSATVTMLSSSVDTPDGQCVFVSLDRDLVDQAAREHRASGKGNRATVVSRSLKVANHSLQVWCVVFRAPKGDA